MEFSCKVTDWLLSEASHGLTSLLTFEVAARRRSSVTARRGLRRGEWGAHPDELIDLRESSALARQNVSQYRLETPNHLRRSFGGTVLVAAHRHSANLRQSLKELHSYKMQGFRIETGNRIA